MRAENRKFVQRNRPMKRLGAGLAQVEAFRFPKSLGYRPHSSSVRKIGSEEPISLTAGNCGVIAPGNHWILDSLRGAPPPGEAFGVLPHQKVFFQKTIVGATLGRPPKNAVFRISRPGGVGGTSRTPSPTIFGNRSIENVGAGLPDGPPMPNGIGIPAAKGSPLQFAKFDCVKELL